MEPLERQDAKAGWMDCPISKLTTWLLHKTYPWMHVVVLVGAIALCPNPRHTRYQLRFWRAFYKLDLAALLANFMELAQPEFWV